ncbi:MAG: DUF2945 domain-containing protein [Devosia sp.]
MANDLKRGDHVSWKWGAHTAEGIVAQKFTSRVRRVIKGKAIIRNASDDKPAYLVRQVNGGTALKSGSELTKA